MSLVPEIGFLRLSHIVGDLKSIPPRLPIIPISKSAWWAGIGTGRFPKPVKIAERVTVWRVEDIRDLINKIEHEDYQKSPGSIIE